MSVAIKKVPFQRRAQMSAPSATTTVHPSEQESEFATSNKPEQKADQARAEKPETEEYVPTPREQATIERHRAQTADDSPQVLINGINDTISINHPHQGVGWLLLMEALGTRDGDVASGLVQQLANIAGRGYNCTNHQLNFLVSLLKGMQLKNHKQLMLGGQAVALYSAVMMMAERLSLAIRPHELDLAVRLLSKLAQIHAATIETLNRCQSGGQDGQHVVLQQNVLNQPTVNGAAVAAGGTTPDKAAAAGSACADSSMSERMIVLQKA